MLAELGLGPGIEGGLMTRPRVAPLIAVAVLVGSLLAACSSSAKKVAAPITTVTAAGQASTTSTPPALTASFRGVTATTIKLGIVNIDYTCIKQFVDYNFGNQAAIDQVFIDDLNAHGGILGRKVVPVYKGICPIGNTTSLAVCTSLTDDEKVFAVMGLLYDTSGDADLCVSRDHQTVLISFLPRQKFISEAPPALLLSTDITTERLATVLFNLLKSQGTLAGKKVATLTDTSTVDEVTGVIKPELDSMGLAQGSPAVLTITGSDTSAAQSQLSAFIEKWKGEGVDAIWLAGADASGKQFVERIKAAMPNVLLLADTFPGAQQAGQDETTAGKKPNPYDGMLSATGLTDDEQWQSASLQSCVKTYEAGSGQQVVSPDDLKPGPDGVRSRVWAAVRDMCNELDMFVAIATKAGPNLTNDTWRQAADSIGEIHQVDPYASIHAGKYDATDAFRLVAFDSTFGTKGDFKPLTPIEDASK
ncbi:MAG: ABC transporter substrate-binding protein [Acidimicrobiales bacterium]